MSLKAEASRHFLGLLWWIIEPLLYLGVFYLVFGLGLRHGGEGYLGYLLCGLVVWKWCDGAVKACAVSITQNVGIMYQIYLPKFVFPAISILAATYRFFVIFGIFLIALILMGEEVKQSWLWLPVLLLWQIYFICAVGFLVAALVPLIPDLRLVTNYTMMMLFFSSGIFFDLSSIDADIRHWLEYNPFLVVIEAYRAVLLSGSSPDFEQLLMVFLFSTVLLLVDFLILAKFDRVYPRLVN